MLCDLWARQGYIPIMFAAAGINTETPGEHDERVRMFYIGSNVRYRCLGYRSIWVHSNQCVWPNEILLGRTRIRLLLRKNIYINNKFGPNEFLSLLLINLFSYKAQQTSFLLTKCNQNEMGPLIMRGESSLSLKNAPAILS